MRQPKDTMARRINAADKVFVDGVEVTKDEAIKYAEKNDCFCNWDRIDLGLSICKYGDYNNG